MKTNPHLLSRRRFLQASGALGLGSMLAPTGLWPADGTPPHGARRKIGRPRDEVSGLGYGCMFDISNNLMLLRLALDHGVTYWDTAVNYGNGRSEIGIGNFLEKNPGAREQVFLVTKASRAHGPEDMTRLLGQSLDRLKTDHIDLYCLHGMGSIDQVNRPEIRTWTERAKKDGKIRFFGFSTHSNMEQCLMGAARLDWIDGIMFTCNYRLLPSPAMKAAIDACHDAGIGLTAMKTQGGRSAAETAEHAALLAPLLARGFTPGQAKLKMVMENPKIAVACVQMPNLSLCRENIGAALDRRQLAESDRAVLARYAAATCNGYCAGCRQHCDAALGGAVSVQEVMRLLMYHHNYKEVDARAMFGGLPPAIRFRLATLDYSAVERACPHRLPIGRLMREATEVFV